MPFYSPCPAARRSAATRARPDRGGAVWTGDATLNAPADDPRSSLDTPGRDIRQDTWWTGFGDERLDRLVAQALAANSDLAAAGLAVQRSRLQAGLASNALWPQPSSSGVSGSASPRHRPV